jgi:pilus assembly protein CpaE
MADKIKVLIVDDNETTRDNTMRLLDYEDDIEVVGFADTGEMALDRVAELGPDVVLMDINMPGEGGIVATRRLREESPRTQVIVVTVQDDSHYLKEAFRAGAVDFVPKPPKSEELTEAIRRAFKQIPPLEAVEPVAMPEQMARMPGYGYPMPSVEGTIITVIGFKGGVGKTTMAVNLSVGLAHAGKRVVLVDSNLLFGDVSVFLNTRSPYTIINLARMALDPDQLDAEATEGILVEHESGLKLLTAPANPSDSEAVSQVAMSNLLAYLKRDFEYVIVDTSVNFDEVLAASIESADLLIAVTAPNMPTLKDTRILFSELTALEYPMDNVLLILNWVDRNSRITPDQIVKFLNQPIAAQIPTDMTAVESVNDGLPLISQNTRRAPAVRELNRLVQLVRERVEAADDQLPEPDAPDRRRRV